MMMDATMRISLETEHSYTTVRMNHFMELFQLYTAEKRNISVISVFSDLFFVYNYSICLIYSILTFSVNSTWVHVRSCNTRDSISDAKDAEAYLCHADLCNSGIKFNSKISIILLAIFTKIIRVLLQ